MSGYYSDGILGEDPVPVAKAEPSKLNNGITGLLALAIRNRGLLLPVNGNYANPRLGVIAAKMQSLMAEFNVCDIEIAAIAETEGAVDESVDDASNDGT